LPLPRNNGADDWAERASLPEQVVGRTCAAGAPAWEAGKPTGGANAARLGRMPSFLKLLCAREQGPPAWSCSMPSRKHLAGGRPKKKKRETWQLACRRPFRHFGPKGRDFPRRRPLRPSCCTSGSTVGNQSKTGCPLRLCSGAMESGSRKMNFGVAKWLTSRSTLSAKRVGKA